MTHHLLLGVACVALFATGLRIAARASERRVDRLLAALVLAAALAVVEALVLGLVRLGSDPIALTLAAVASYAVVRLRVPGSAPAAPWALGPRERLAVGACAGIALLIVVWPLRYPLIGFDGAVYHLPEIAGWVNGGRPGEIETVSYLFPFASYPVTNEVLLTWASGIARSLVPLLLWTQIALLATALATFAGVRALGASRRASGLAAAALVSTPVLVQQLGTPSTDAAALLWLACAGALGASARERPGLLAPALVAAGLAAGTKTTVLPLALVVIALGGWCLRAQLRAHARSLAAAALLALAVGAVWLARNTVTHGWPLWPFESRLGADPVPPVWAQIDASLLERPGATLSGRVGGYLDQFGGAVLLVAAGVLAWLAARRRAVAVASAITAGAALLWALAPSTGKPDSPVFDVNLLSTTRYALPAVAAGAVALALASRAAAAAVLGAAVVWNVVLDVQLGHLTLPYAWAFAAAAALGVFVARFAGRRPALPRAALPAAAVAAAAALALPADGLVARHAAAAPTIPGASVAAWAARQPGFEGGATIRFAGTVIGQLAGDRLQHRLVLLAPDAPCDEVHAAAAHGLLVVAEPAVFARLHVRTPAACAAGLTPSFVSPGVQVFGRLRAGG